MSKNQFWLLNFTSVLLALLIIAHFVFVKINARSGETLERERALINNGRQIESVLDQLAKRIARGSDTDPQLKTNLIQHHLKVTLEVDGKTKAYP